MRKRTTLSWVEAWLGGAWVPFDPAGNNYAHLPSNYLALYYGDLPLIEHTARLGVHYEMLMHQVTRQSLLTEEGEAPPRGAHAREVSWESERVRTYAFYAEQPVASVVLITDHEIPEGVIAQIVDDARERAITIVFLNARFESRYLMPPTGCSRKRTPRRPGSRKRAAMKGSPTRLSDKRSICDSARTP